jgi:hypothetical protein
MTWVLQVTACMTAQLAHPPPAGTDAENYATDLQEYVVKPAGAPAARRHGPPGFPQLCINVTTLIAITMKWKQ